MCKQLCLLITHQNWTKLDQVGPGELRPFLVCNE